MARGAVALTGAAATVIAVAWLAMRPSPTQVETHVIGEGPMEVTIDEQGETRAHDRYVVTAPFAGRVTRIDLHEGDRVANGDVIAWLTPPELDTRALSSAQARLRAAEALGREAAERVLQARAQFSLAESEASRAEKLLASGDVPVQAVERVRTQRTAAGQELAAAVQREQAAAAEIEGARAAATPPAQSGPVAVRAPLAGRVLQIAERSARSVEAGAPLLTLGDARHLEAVVELLTSDAVRVRPGQTVRFEEWGGPEPLAGTVRVVEPLGFTKVSALGIEEKRVRVIADLVRIPPTLGEGYRVEARIVVWKSSKCVKAPVGALFRDGADWAVFAVEGEVAVRRAIRIGARNQREVEVLDGLRRGDVVVTHPPRGLSSGSRVAAYSGT